MTSYTLPVAASRPASAPKTAYLITSGDLRESANTAGWATQAALEVSVTSVFNEFGWNVIRAFDVDRKTGHGYISSQRMGMEVFKNIPTDAPLIVAIANWQYSHHVLAGLRTHEGPILTTANFAPDWPGLVGLLGLNAGLTKMGKPYSSTWSVDFSDEWFKATIKEWIETGIFHIETEAERRFVIRQSVVEPDGLLVASVEDVSAEPPAAVPDELGLAVEILRHIVDEYGDARFPAPHAYDDAVWVGYRLSEVLPLKLSVKQNLLEMNDSVTRLRILNEFLKRQIN